MFPNTHKLIAEKVYLALEEELGVHLHYASLKYGSVAPDYKPSLMIKSHRKKNSYKLVTEIVSSLDTIQASNSLYYTKEFSYKIGLIIHFVTDYFCRAHNENKYYNFILHFLYESNLNNFCMRRFTSNGEVIKWDMVRKWNLYSNFEELLEAMLKEYHSKKPSFTLDMEYSVAVSTMVAMSLVQACNKKECLVERSNIQGAMLPA